MNLHEYQSKTLFQEYGLPVSSGKVVRSASEVPNAISELSGDSWVAKVQVHAGGRGKAGGVKIVSSIEAGQEFAETWIGERLVTQQTDAEGQEVACVYFESLTNIARELYLGIVIDRATQRVVVMASTEGGVDIETVAAETPEKILRATIDPATGAESIQGRAMADGLGLEKKQVQQFTAIFLNLCRLFHELDCALVEVNPLVITSEGDVHCLDAKINIDSNALFRQPNLVKLRDPTQEDPREVHAAKFNLSYVSMDGSIGCMVNGAGLAMGTMDLVQLYGGSPANFLDVGGGVNATSVAEAFKIILSDPKVRAVLINIFGGIVSCAVIAEGIVEAYREVGVSVPVIVRFDGNSADEGRDFLRASGLAIITADTLQDAAHKAVAATGASS